MPGFKTPRVVSGHPLRPFRLFLPFGFFFLAAVLADLSNLDFRPPSSFLFDYQACKYVLHYVLPCLAPCGVHFRFRRPPTA